ncbi:hypothetical protein IC608_02900 [Devosia sp. PTR5]|uniref:Uncharacterized protein n=1 Tax=Devosia oryzisoli TaxID=2774138 RepID=A0A927FSN0_9HYPH|nr:hypothetical protein [Devosia oryzisoli]MBD8064424.1 hypothetical protein [Devosia oryzisoli]
MLSPVGSAAYLTGFPKVNNPERFMPDIWEAAANFDRRYRPSAVAEAERIAYLYPAGSGGEETLRHYLESFMALVDRASAAGMAVHVVKLPVPPRFYAQLPGEADFDRSLGDQLKLRGLELEDYSALLPEARYYFDSDHLGRQGVEALAEQVLVPLMKEPVVVPGQGTAR